MQIAKILITDALVKVDYSTDAGVYKIGLDGTLASMDLIKAIGKLNAIFTTRLCFDDVRHKDMTIPSGVETGNDDSGDWYCVHGTYTANNITYKLKTGKMREMNYELPEDQEPEDYPWLLTEEEMGQIIDVITEASLFVDGKRRPEPQGELDLFADETGEVINLEDAI